MRKRKKCCFAYILAAALGMSFLMPACGNPEESQNGILSAEEEAGNGIKKEDLPAARLSAADAGEAVAKDETVTVKADSLGHPEKTTVEVSLTVPEGKSVVQDQTKLTDIRNTSGDEEYVLSPDGTLLWESEGKKITYEGSADSELPVSVQVSYYLNGNRISPADLAHKSGQIRIRFDYQNHTSYTASVDGQTVETAVPFLVLSMAVLPEDHFSNVEVTNGKLIRLGDQAVALGYALPGVDDTMKLSDYEVTEELELPSYVEISADAKDFELEFTETICSSGLFSDLDTEKLDDADDLTDAMHDLKDASGKLAEGTGDLLEGAETFRQYLVQYTNGAGEITSNLSTLSGALKTLDGHSSELQNGSRELTEGLTTLDDSLAGIEEQIGVMAGQQEEISQSIQQQMQQAAESMQTQMQSAAQVIQQGAEEVGKTAQDVDRTAQELNQAVDDLNQLIEEINQAASDAGLESSVQPVDPVNLDQLRQIESQLSQMDDSVSADLPELDWDDAASAMNTQEESGMDSSAGILEFQTQFTKLKEGVAQLKDGSAAITEGLDAYCDGVHKTAQGAEALANGASAMTEGGDGLNQGYDGMIDGISVLNDGMHTFDEEGIRELNKLAGEELESVIRGIKALKDADLSYTNYSGIREGVDGSVRILIETDEIR